MQYFPPICLDHCSLCIIAHCKATLDARKSPRNSRQRNPDHTTDVREDRNLFSKPSVPSKEGRHIINIVSYNWRLGCILPQMQVSNFDRSTDYWSKMLIWRYQPLHITYYIAITSFMQIKFLLSCRKCTKYMVRFDRTTRIWNLNLLNTAGKLAKSRLRLLKERFDLTFWSSIQK